MTDENVNEFTEEKSSAEVFEFLENIKQNRLKSTVPFKEFGNLFKNKEVIRTLASRNRKNTTLYTLQSKVERSGKFDFFQAVFSASEIIPKAILADLWYSCYSDRTSPRFQQVDTPTGRLSIPANPCNTEQFASLPITDPMLIDNRAVIFRYCQAEKPGWKFLRYIHGRRSTTLRLPEPLRQSIKDDSPEAFSMFLCMSGTNLSYSLFDEILKQGAVHIFGQLLREAKITEKIISLPELCCRIVAGLKDCVSVPLLEELENLHPGIIRETIDPFGRNLLWYAIQNMETGFFHPNCLLTPFLLEHGCSPDNKNTIGLTWNEIFLSLNRKRKQSLMLLRYNKQIPYHGPYGQSLRQLQGPDDLL